MLCRNGNGSRFLIKLKSIRCVNQSNGSDPSNTFQHVERNSYRTKNTFSTPQPCCGLKQNLYLNRSNPLSKTWRWRLQRKRSPANNFISIKRSRMQNLNDPCSGLERIPFFHAHQLNLLIHHRILRTIRNFLRPWSPYSDPPPPPSPPQPHLLHAACLLNIFSTTITAAGESKAHLLPPVISIFRAMIYFHSMWSYDYGFTEKNKVNFCRRRCRLSPHIYEASNALGEIVIWQLVSPLKRWSVSLSSQPLERLEICVTIAKFFHMIKQNPNEFISSSSVLLPFIILESSSMELSCCYVSGENTMETGEKQR